VVREELKETVKLYHSREQEPVDSFEDLWNDGLDAIIKIKDIRSNKNAEEGFTELIENPYKTQELLIHHIQKATKEILIILPSINAFFRYRKIGIFNILEKKLLNININNNHHDSEENSNKLLVKILTPTNNNLEKDITGYVQELQREGVTQQTIDALLADYDVTAFERSTQKATEKFTPEALDNILGGIKL